MKQTLILTVAVAFTAALVGCGSPASNTTNTSNSSRMNAAANTNSNSTNTTESPNPMVGGAPMLKNKDIIDNALNSKDHTTLVAAVKAADLVVTLKGPGPFTVFAPTNAAFEKLPKGSMDKLLKPENKIALAKVLTYHVLNGKHDAASISKAIEEGKGKTAFTTVAGGTLTASMEGKDIILTDEKGGIAKITIADVIQSNGVIHVIDTVVMAK